MESVKLVLMVQVLILKHYHVKVVDSIKSLSEANVSV